MKKTVYRAALQGAAAFGVLVILTETVAYTFSFLVSGLIRKDLFNLLEGKPLTFGITSPAVLILLDVAVPLLINAVKQINAGLAAKLRVRIARNVKGWLLDHVLRFPPDEKLPFGEGTVISLFRNECEDVCGWFMEFYYQMPKIVLSCAILLVMFCVNPVFAAVSLFPAALMLALLRRMSRRIAAYRESARSSTGEVTAFLDTFLGNIEFFHMAGDREKVCDTFRARCALRAGNEIRDRVFDRLLGAFSENASDLTLGVILLIAIPFFAAGRFSVGEFVMFEYYYAFLASLPDALGSLIRKGRQTGVAVGRLEHLQRERENRGEGSVRYEDGRLTLSLEADGVRTKIEAHRGQSVLCVCEDRQRGSALLQKLFALCAETLGSGVCGYVPQDPVLFDESIRDNICMDSAYEEERFSEVLEKTDLWEDVKAFPDGIRKNAGRKGTAVSGGQRKRIGIARALYAGAEILFIDGFTDQVDRQTEANMIERIQRQFDGILFIASHSAQPVGSADLTVRR